ncbi:ROK family protein [Pigmentiphaga soli]|uniref:ROK family protein n=1 Tax=Pigmentiphaga soli TaxID=1007095 RepID=A0ABP8GJP3_9BURK
MAFDIGGSGLKAAVIDDDGQLLGEHLRLPTPHPCPPGLLVDTLVGMAASLPAFDRIAIGFPGMIRHGRVLTAVNLSKDDEWRGLELGRVLSDRLGGRPARLVNDADMQGMALVTGEGLEFVFTFGTGVGTSLFRDGELMPHMELGHHPLHKDATYEECLGEAARVAAGNHHWNRHLRRALAMVEVLLRPDRIHIGGGNARHVEGELPPGVVIGSNEAGLLGGAVLWRGAPPKG